MYVSELLGLTRRNPWGQSTMENDVHVVPLDATQLLAHAWAWQTQTGDGAHPPPPSKQELRKRGLDPSLLFWVPSHRTMQGFDAAGQPVTWEGGAFRAFHPADHAFGGTYRWAVGWSNDRPAKWWWTSPYTGQGPVSSGVTTTPQATKVETADRMLSVVKDPPPETPTKSLPADQPSDDPMIPKSTDAAPPPTPPGVSMAALKPGSVKMVAVTAVGLVLLLLLFGKK